MTQPVNFPNSSAPLVHIGSMTGEIDGTLTQTGQYLLQALWAQAFDNAQGTYPTPLATAGRVALPALPGSPTQAQINAQVVVLTELVAALIEDLKQYGALG